MEYIRKVDFTAIERSGADEQLIQRIYDRNSGATNCAINYIKTPPGGGSPGGMHIHQVDQIFYILSGVMSIEIEGKRSECGPGSLIIFPARIPHCNWNGTDKPTVHLAINAPPPDPDVPFVQPV